MLYTVSKKLYETETIYRENNGLGLSSPFTELHKSFQKYLRKNKDNQESVYMLSTSGDEKFGKLTLITAAATTIHMPIILGIIAGSLGALFINLGTRLTLLRKKYLKSDTSKIIEASIVLFLTVSSQCLMLTLIGKCKNIVAVAKKIIDKIS